MNLIGHFIDSLGVKGLIYTLVIVILFIICAAYEIYLKIQEKRDRICYHLR